MYSYRKLTTKLDAILCFSSLPAPFTHSSIFSRIHRATSANAASALDLLARRASLLGGAPAYRAPAKLVTYPHLGHEGIALSLSPSFTFLAPAMHDAVTFFLSHQ